MFTSFISENDVYSKPANNLNIINFNVAETPLTLFNNNSENAVDDTMKIFLRFRPLNINQAESPFVICDPFTISATPPEQSVSYKNLLHGNGKGFQKFSFSKVFIPESDQELVFNDTSKTLLQDFIKGNDRLLFTYGTTSSGKTHTMNGNKSNLGIIPRALFNLFKFSKLSNNPLLMPVDFAEVCQIKKTDSQKLLKEKSILLKLSEKESSDVLHMFSNGEFVDENVLSNNELSDINNNYETTFWISYTEIYNELIYDLLDPVSISSISGNNKLKRPILDIRIARNGGSYVKGLKSYPVYSAEEAYRLLLVGRRSQIIGSTKLNQNSSRSHTILTIRAVRTYPGSEYLSKVCNFSFCDLAGSERTDKAQTSGLMQKEASNINSSLLALGRCIDVLKYNQLNPNNLRIVPYRDSKLTRLFQTYLGGNGKASMIVCVNQDPRLFDETMQVLKFSALAKKVVLFEKEKPVAVNPSKGGQRLSIYRRLGMKTPKTASKRDTIESILAGDDFDSDETIEIATDAEEEEEYEEEYDAQELLDIIERLKTELIAVKKEKVFNEAKLREKLNNDWSQTIMQMERDNAQHIQRIREENQLLMEKRARNERNKAFIQLKKRRMQPDIDLSDSSSDELKFSTLENEIQKLKADLKDSQEETAEARETIEILIQEKEQLQVQCRTLEFRAQISTKSVQPFVKADYSFDESKANVSIMDISCSSLVAMVNPNVSQDNNSTEISTSGPSNRPQQYDIVEYLSSPEAPIPSPIINRSSNHNGNAPCSESEGSFLQHEKECAIDELQNELSRMTLEAGKKSAEICQLQEQLELMHTKIASREKSIEKYVAKEAEAGKLLNILLSQLQVPTSNDIGKIRRKLKLLSRAIQKIHEEFVEIIPERKALSDWTNSPDASAGCDNFHSLSNQMVAHARKLDRELQATSNKYRKLLSICNRCIIDKAAAFLEMDFQILSVDTSLSVVAQTFQSVWKSAIDKVESLAAPADGTRTDQSAVESQLPTNSSDENDDPSPCHSSLHLSQNGSDQAH